MSFSKRWPWIAWKWDNVTQWTLHKYFEMHTNFLRYPSAIVNFCFLFFRYPQYIFPSTAYVAAPSTASLLTAASAVPQSPLSPTTGGHLIDYTTAYASQFAAANAGTYEAATYPYASSTNGFVTPAGTAYTYAAVPQPAIVAGGSTIHYQPQQLQERMQ